MQTRSEEMQRFLAAAKGLAAARAASAGATEAVSSRIFSALQGHTAPQQDIAPGRLPVCRHLDAALRFATEQAGPIGELAAAFAGVEPRLQWRTRAGAAAHGAHFVENHANALLIGAQGCEVRSDVQVGVSLMSPHTQYPRHQHPPEEIYIVMSEGEWLQESDPWFAPGVGNLVHNRSNIWHAMRSGERPLLAFWFLLDVTSKEALLF